MKNSNYLIASLAAFALLHSTANAVAECMATLKDPHGSVVVPCNGGTKATLKGGEHFLADPRPDGWDVYLKSGCHGFIGKVELQLLPNELLMTFTVPRATGMRFIRTLAHMAFRTSAIG